MELRDAAGGTVSEVQSEIISGTMVVFQYVEQHLAQPALGLRHHRILNVFLFPDVVLYVREYYQCVL